MIQILNADLTHVEAIAPLFDAYREFYKQSSDLQAGKVFLRERLANKEAILFLAIEKGSALGFVQLYPSYSSISMKRIWILYDLFVAPEARHRGVAAALLKRAQSFAAETHAEELILDTAIDNVAAQRLYEKLGWKRDTLFHRYIFTI